MFECARGHLTQPREKEVRVPTEIRTRDYRDEHGNVIGRGWEIVQEERLCVAHAIEHGVTEGYRPLGRTSRAQRRHQRAGRAS
jgi:hypothetical protein